MGVGVGGSPELSPSSPPLIASISSIVKAQAARISKLDSQFFVFIIWVFLH